MQGVQSHIHPPFPNPMLYPTRRTIQQSFELRDVYKPHRPSPVARLELVSAQYVICLIDALEDILLAFPLGDRFAHFTTNGMPPLPTTLPNYTPTCDRMFDIWGLNCRMVELSKFTDFVLPPADHMATTVTDSLNYHLDTTKGRTELHALHSSLTAPGVDASSFPTEAALITNGPGGVGAIAVGNEAATFADTRKMVLSLTSPLPLFYATTLQKIAIHLMPDPINPQFLRIYRVPKAHARERRSPSPQAYPTHPSRSQPHRPRDRPSQGSNVDLQRPTPPGKITPRKTPSHHGTPQDHLR
jgi:hypothetical protein